MISIILPTFNEAAEIEKTLAAVKRLGGNTEIIVADGGSNDKTAAIARQFGAIVVESPRGRGDQMRAAALKSSGEILWFVHADSRPSPVALNEIREALEDPSVVAGNFTLRFAGASRPAKFMTWFYRHIRKIGLLYGDSGIFVRREAYDCVGGFKPLPLFEDLELVRRLRKIGKVVTLNAEILTSSRRFENRAFLPVFIRWILFQCLYWIGVSPHRMARIYHSAKPSSSSANTPHS
ncbi:MAG: TIGR04283 family arsenosugar biosynthesis glycosyltransferase [Pyrinomonadaceae bacterium]